MRIIVLGFFSISVVVYAASNGVHGVSGGDFSPTWAVFIAAVPVLFFNYVAPPRAAAVPHPVGQRRRLSQFIPPIVLIGLGLVFYWAGRGTRSKVAEIRIADPSLTDQVT